MLIMTMTWTLGIKEIGLFVEVELFESLLSGLSNFSLYTFWYLVHGKVFYMWI